MSNEVSVNLHCIVIRQGAQIWIEESKLARFDEAYKRAKQDGGLIFFDEERFSPSDVVGVFSARRIDEMTRRKNGQWQCEKQGTWHDRFEKCDCTSKEAIKLNEDIQKAMDNCDICKNKGSLKGFIETERGLARCKCVRKFFNKK